MKLFTLNINTVTPEEFGSAFSVADSERQRYIDCAVKPETKKLRIAADMLARKAISEYCSIPQSEILFSKSKSGKPYVLECDDHFSISHSGEWVICAVDSREIGADIEKIRPIRKNIYERFAAPCEIDYINESPENLFRIWVLKEAYFKCIGTGLGANIKNVTFTVDANEIRCSESGFEFQFLPSPVGYVAAVCIKTR